MRIHVTSRGKELSLTEPLILGGSEVQIEVALINDCGMPLPCRGAPTVSVCIPLGGSSVGILCSEICGDRYTYHLRAPAGAWWRTLIRRAKVRIAAAPRIETGLARDKPTETAVSTSSSVGRNLSVAAVLSLAVAYGYALFVLLAVPIAGGWLDLTRNLWPLVLGIPAFQKGRELWLKLLHSAELLPVFALYVAVALGFMLWVSGSRQIVVNRTPQEIPELQLASAESIVASRDQIKILPVEFCAWKSTLRSSGSLDKMAPNTSPRERNECALLVEPRASLPWQSKLPGIRTVAIGCTDIGSIASNSRAALEQWRKSGRCSERTLTVDGDINEVLKKGGHSEVRGTASRVKASWERAPLTPSKFGPDTIREPEPIITCEPKPVTTESVAPATTCKQAPLESAFRAPCSVLTARFAVESPKLGLLMRGTGRVQETRIDQVTSTTDLLLPAENPGDAVEMTFLSGTRELGTVRFAAQQNESCSIAATDERLSALVLRKDNEAVLFSASMPEFITEIPLCWPGKSIEQRPKTGEMHLDRYWVPSAQWTLTLPERLLPEAMRVFDPEGQYWGELTCAPPNRNESESQQSNAFTRIGLFHVSPAMREGEDAVVKYLGAVKSNEKKWASTWTRSGLRGSDSWFWGCWPKDEETNGRGVKHAWKWRHWDVSCGLKNRECTSAPHLPCRYYENGQEAPANCTEINNEWRRSEFLDKFAKRECDPALFVLCSTPRNSAGFR